jgi:indole-3-glycerol phosphate synthase
MSLNQVAPSRRDFTLFVATHKQGIAVVPRLKRLDPETGGAWPGIDLTEMAGALDDADTAAIAVSTARRHGGSLADLRAVADAVTAPVLRDDLIVDARQLYDSRLGGADAVVLPAAYLGGDRLRELAAVAASLHMAAIVEVTAAADVKLASALANACIGLRCNAGSGFADLGTVAALARSIPAQRTVVLLDEVRGLDELLALKGLIDAAVVGDALLAAGDAGAAIADFTRRAG